MNILFSILHFSGVFSSADCWTDREKKGLLPQLKRPPLLESGAVSEDLMADHQGDAQEAVNRRRDSCQWWIQCFRTLCLTQAWSFGLLYMPTPFRFTMTSQRTLILRLALHCSLVFACQKIFGVPIRPLRLLSSGDAGTSPSAIGCGTTFITLLVVQGRTEHWEVYRNIILTMVVIGIWHGASWNFVIYGCLHGSAVSLNRFFRQRHGRRPGEPLPGPWAWAWRFFLTFNFVVWARVLFGTANLVDARDFLENYARSQSYALGCSLSTGAWVVLALGYAWHFTPQRWTQRLGSVFRLAPPAARAVVAALIGVACWAYRWTATFFRVLSFWSGL